MPQLRGLDRFISFTKEGGQGIYYNCPLVIDGVPTERPGKYITEDLTDLAIEFITNQNDLRPRELFDLQMDPQEKNNIVDQPEGKEIIRKIETEMEQLKKSTGYRFFTKG